MNSENTYKGFYQQRPPSQKQQLQSRYNRQLPSYKSAQEIDRLMHLQNKFVVMAQNNDVMLTDAVVPQNSNDPMVFASAVPVFSPPLAPPDTTDNNKNSTVLVKQEQTAIVTQAYPDVYRDEPFLQQPQQNLIVNPVPYYLTIDSRDRDRNVWANTNQYRIPLVAPDNNLNILSPNVRYKNIYSISLLSCVVPNDGGVMFEPYLLLQIDEIDRVYDSADIPCARAFTKLYFKEVCPMSKFYRLDKGVGDPLTKIYWPAPRASLESITLSFRHPDGTLFDFGPDNPLPQPVNPLLQTTITLEIRTFVTDVGKAIGHRNP